MADYLDRLTGVFGHPVAENPGVVIMDAAYKSIGAENWRFLTIDVAPENLEAAMGAVRALGMRGINLTIPHKIEVMKYIDSLSEEAQLIGAVNTVVNDGGRLTGYNTDGKGFMISLKNNGIDPKGKKIVMLGSGGVARAMGTELCLAGAGKLRIVSIEHEPAKALAERLDGISDCEVTFEPWEKSHAITADTDILVNATPLGLYPDTQRFPDIDYGTVKPDMFVQDVIPNPATTSFIKKVRERGAKTGTGMGMMIAQAALNTELWAGSFPDEKAMTAAFLREIE